MFDADAISESQVYRIHNAVLDGDEEIFIDHRRSGAVRERPSSGDPDNIKKVEEYIADDPHVSIRILASRTDLSVKVVRTILKQLGKVKKFCEFVPGILNDTNSDGICLFASW